VHGGTEFSRQGRGEHYLQAYILMKGLARAYENLQISGIPQNLFMIIIRCIVP
jgi:hypothetical protein